MFAEKKILKYFVLVGVCILVLGFFAIPSFAQTIKDFFLANVVGSSVCPKGNKGDDKTFENEIAVHVNKTIGLPAGYTPENLVDISKVVKSVQRICLKKEALDALQVMFADAAKDNVSLAATSAFRSSSLQSKFYNALYSLKGEKAKDRIAPPNHSEHQLGTTVDLSGKSIDYISASDKFTGTPEELWLRVNAYKYGFVQSYPKGQTSITGYDHESWHYRYLGVDIAKVILKEGITIEEYFQNMDAEG